ncbi:M23 family metallopeptidase [Pedobacter sp. JCM 36344]|uniref:M23 family metallopeptidase n=1 Tax=Pedobacter sp. JCM 36344 TaxID=3374280 RepID=UPI00397CC272
MIKFKLITVFLLSIGVQAFAQQIFSDGKYPLVDFRPPLNITPPALAGSFGELRSNHFHSGMDYRTNQRIGYPVYAIADGYISRLRVQNSGFGLALYINHKNGFTSVYGHLSRFNTAIARQVKSIQYQKKSYEIDDFPNELSIPVRKGDVIAYSGNTGSSGGPHLHFEIRDTKTEATINPQLFGLNITDNIPPVIYSLYAYKLNKRPFNEFTPKQTLATTGSAGNYKAGTVNLTGEVGFGIVTADRHNGASGLNGVYSIELLLDENHVFTSSLEKFVFENSKAINSHIDYPTYLSTKRSIQKSFVDPGNPLSIYSNLVNRGHIEFNDGKLHKLQYIVTDGSGNKSTLSFNVQADAKPAIYQENTASETARFPYDIENQFYNDKVKVVLPKGTLYNDLNFIYKSSAKPVGNAYSAIHQIHNNLTPLHVGFELWINAEDLPENLRSKAVIVSSSRASQGGYFENGYVKAKPRNFGSFFISTDTLSPVILPQNIHDGKSMAGISKISFKIRDNLSGIQNFNGFIDGKWVLMEFDTKTASLWHTFDEQTGPGKHNFELIVKDMKDNSKTYSITFYK